MFFYVRRLLQAGRHQIDGMVGVGDAAKLHLPILLLLLLLL